MNAYTLACYDRLGITLRDLGCVMLDLEPVEPLPTIPAKWLYTSSDPDLAHVDGLIAEHHTTLLFGLLRNAHEWLLAIDEVLEGWEPYGIDVADVTIFPSSKRSEPYACIVAELESDSLRDAHARLSLLPHIDTHPTYRPHVTLAYVKAERAYAAAQEFRNALPGLEFLTLGLNYGDQSPKE